MILALFIFGSSLGLAWCLLMLYRVTRVFAWRSQILNESPADYYRLPPYEVMVRRFWIWEARNFLPKGGD